MTKTLTEQWREGKLLDGAYYILVDKYEQNEPEIDVGVCYNSNFEWWIVKEVLAPVPSYDEYRELLDLNVYEKDRKKVMGLEDKVEHLQEQLNEANDCINSAQISLRGYMLKINEYKKKWGVK